MAKHAENIAAFGCPCVIALNVFDSDAEEDIAIVEREADGVTGYPSSG